MNNTDELLRAAAEAAAERGDSDTVLDIGAEYYNGSDRVRQDFAKAVAYYRIAAKMGNVIAMSNLGYCYLYGRSVAPDAKKALYCFEKAAAAGDINATYKLGDFYLYGTAGFPKDKARATEYYFRALGMVEDGGDADLWNVPDVYLRVADCYFYGGVKKKDPAAAHKYYSLAAELFRERIAMGDRFTDKLLVRAVKGAAATGR